MRRLSCPTAQARTDVGYFANGTEGEMFRESYCYHCANWRDLNDGRGPGCPIMDAHFVYAREECNSESNAKAILDMLIPPKTIIASDGFSLMINECSMFLPSAGEEGG